MLEVIILGIGSGLGLSLMLGPAFFSLLQTSISRGFRSAAQLALGIFLSDVFLVALMLFFGAAVFFDKPTVKEIVGLVGGGILVGIGVHTILNRGKGYANETDAEKDSEQIEKLTILQKTPKPIVYCVKGFFLNLTNPGTWIFWLLYVSAVKSQYTDTFSLLVFSLCTLGTVLSTDILKAYGANQLKRWVNDVLMAKINICFGIILIGFGVFLIIKSVYPIIQMTNVHIPMITG